MLVHLFAILRARSCEALSRPPSPLGPLPNVSSTATRAGAEIRPACLVPPPNIFLMRRACVMNLVDPIIIEPMGAPRPLDRQRDTLSQREVYSGREPAPEATASHRRAPSMWRIILFCLAKVEISRKVESGITIPFRVFSRDMMRVGQAWTSSEIIM